MTSITSTKINTQTFNNQIVRGNKKLHINVSICRLQLKSVQTTAEVCTDYTCSLHRLRRGFKFRKRMIYFAFVYLAIKWGLCRNEFRHSPLIKS